jgi:hypothetical protein
MWIMMYLGYIYCVVIVRAVVDFDMIFGSWLRMLMRINGQDGWTRIDAGELGRTTINEDQ